jgi:hypothetical protein
MDPINYKIDVGDPFASAVQGFQVGSAIRQQQIAQQQAIQQQMNQQQMQADLRGVAMNPNATGADYAGLMTKYPQIAEQLGKGWGVLNEQQKQTKLNQAGQVYSALQAGKPDIAANYLTDIVSAAKNSGDQQGAAAAQTMLDHINDDPEAAKASVGMMLVSQAGPEKFGEAFSKFNAENRAQQLAPADLRTANAKAGTAEAEEKIKSEESKVAAEANRLGLLKTKSEIANINSQITERSKRLALDQDRLATETALKLKELNQKSTELGADARKLVNDSVVASVAADNSAQKMVDLADRLETSGAASGIGAKGMELYKSITGNQDAVSQLRQEYTRLRSTQVSKMLPPGPASDKDIQLALQGFPSENANPKMMASFVRGMAKLSNYESAVESAKSEWVNSVGHLGRPKTDIVVGGTKVPAGTTFADFSKLKVQENASARQAEQEAQHIQGRSYMKYANPAGQ